MQQKLFTNILTPISREKAEYLDQHIITIEDCRIVDITPKTKNTDMRNILDRSHEIVIPGLIDAHVHLPQLPIIGLYGKPLLQWLNDYTFPTEKLFANEQYARKLSKRFFNLLKHFGTTTASIYATIHQNSTAIAFEEAIKSGLRIFMGKVNMDQNSPDYLTESAIDSLVSTETLYQKYNHITDSVSYTLSPRFAISTSIHLMAELRKIVTNNDFIQTHCNETTSEKNAIRKLYPAQQTYVDVYKEAGILGSRTLLAHMIHNEPTEIAVIQQTNTRVVHCPDANIFLSSGRFPLELWEEAQVPIGLGSDVGAGTSLDMFKIMKSMIFMQSLYTKETKVLVSPTKAFYYATLGNAKVLHLDKTIGTIRKGHRAEILFLNIDPKSLLFKTADELLGHLIFQNKFIKRELYMLPSQY